MNLNYQELKDYIKLHPQDEEAFQHFLSLMREKPGVVVKGREFDGDRASKKLVIKGIRAYRLGIEDKELLRIGKKSTKKS